MMHGSVYVIHLQPPPPIAMPCMSYCIGEMYSWYTKTVSL
jgi:hypothetical protein